MSKLVSSSNSAVEVHVVVDKLVDEVIDVKYLIRRYIVLSLLDEVPKWRRDTEH